MTVAATTATFAFRPDVPGDYQLRLTASDGFSNDSDTMRVSADRLFRVTGNPSFKIDGASPAGSDRLDLKLKTSPRFSGTPVSFSATSDVPWLTVPATGTLGGANSETTLTVSLNLAEVKGLANGEHVARVTITPQGGWTGESPDVKLDLALPRVRNVLPYVAYVNEPARVTLYGEKLRKADGKSLFIGGVEAPNLDAASDTRATIELPPLPAGTYTVRIQHALDVAPEMARVVVRTLPVYLDVDRIAIDGSIQSLAYDPERDAIYYVMIAPDGQYFTQSLRKDATGGWASGAAPPISAPSLAPRAIALSSNGTELYVSSLGCVLHRVNADTLAIVESVQKSCDANSYFEEIVPLADGRVLLVAHGGGAGGAVFEFPGFAPSGILPVKTEDAEAILNAQRDRLLYVNPTDGVTPRGVDVYDIEDARSRSVTLSEPAFGPVTMDGDGSRTLDSINLYDRDLRLLGRLVADVPYGAPGTALNFSGTRAVALDEQTEALYVHDVSGPGPSFPQLGAPMPLPDEASTGATLIVPPTGGAVFAIALIDAMAGRGSFAFYVRTNPAITR